MSKYIRLATSLPFILALAWQVLFSPAQLLLATSLEQQYQQGRKYYRQALATLPAIEDRRLWFKCINSLEKLLQQDRSAKYADRCLYLIAQSYHHLYDRFQTQEYFDEALVNYRRLVRQYPKSKLADDAQFLIGILYYDRDPAQAYLEFVKVTTFFPKGDMAKRAKQRAQRLEKRILSTCSNQETPPKPLKTARLERIQHWSTKNYTRVVLYFSAPVEYKHHKLPPDKKNRQPARIYLDFVNCIANVQLRHKIDIMDGLLRDIRVGQYQPTRARVVLDIESIKTDNVFTLSHPFRIVIDIHGKTNKTSFAKKTGAGNQKIPSLARQLALGVKLIVLDPGHGGRDKGAIGPHGIYEKDITLALAKRVKKVLEKSTGCKVILTRSTDRYLTLEERTAIANTLKADLFISLHTNAHLDHSIHGTETYYLNLSTDPESARVAAFENATTKKKISDLEAILKDLMRNTKIDESSQLATSVHRQLIRTLSKKYRKIHDLGVKQAPFYVLLGAEMPSILIETAFISNPSEERLLRSRKFQQTIAIGISRGVKAYIKEAKELALSGETP